MSTFGCLFASRMLQLRNCSTRARPGHASFARSKCKWRARATPNSITRSFASRATKHCTTNTEARLNRRATRSEIDSSELSAEKARELISISICALLRYILHLRGLQAPLPEARALFSRDSKLPRLLLLCVAHRQVLLRLVRASIRRRSSNSRLEQRNIKQCKKERRTRSEKSKLETKTRSQRKSSERRVCAPLEPQAAT